MVPRLNTIWGLVLLVSAGLSSASDPGWTHANRCLGPVCVDLVDVSDKGRALTIRNSDVALRTVHRYFRVSGMDLEYLVPARFTLGPGQVLHVARVLQASGGFEIDPRFAHNHGGPVEGVEDIEYRLPIPAGAPYRINQSPHLVTTHKPWERHAYDFGVDVGTPVLAARAGTVIRAVDRFAATCAKPTRGCRASANRVVVQHGDGSLALYVHLQPHSVRVRPGQPVAELDWIASSGNTGYSTGPHLHFEVAAIDDNLKRQSLPVRFEAGVIPEH